MGLGNTAVESLAVNRHFWDDKRVFMTGHTGFKGSWLSLWLQDMGARLTGYSIGLPTTPSLFELAGVGENMQSITGDARDLEHLTSCMQDQAPEVVIHMAAQSLVRLSYEAPVETYSTNVLGTVNLLEAARRCPSVRVVIVVTSDKCYENREWLWGYRENEPLGGHDPYSSSKACAELVTSAYRASFFDAAKSEQPLPAVASVRAGNVIGGGDWAPDRIIPDVICALQAGVSVEIRNPDAVRPWQFVLEPIRGYLSLAERLWDEPRCYSGAWNFGPDDDDTTTVSAMVERLTDAWGHDAGWLSSSRHQPHEAGELKLDCTKAKRRLGWAPVQPLTISLEWIAEWYRTYFETGDAREITLAQIGRYEAQLAR